MSDSTLSQAYAAAERAESLSGTQALEAHQQAAELFTAALDGTTDAGAQRSIRAMALQQTRLAADLARTSAAATGPPATTTTRAPSASSQRRSSKYGADVPPFSVLVSPRSPLRRPTEGAESTATSAAGSPSSSRGPSQHASHLFASSTLERTLDESFMVLRRDKASDPFQRFWGVVEGMLTEHSSPVAFASAPLGSLMDPKTGRVSKPPTSTSSSPPRKLKPSSLRSSPVQSLSALSSAAASSSTSPAESFYVINSVRSPTTSSSSSSSNSTSPTSSAFPPATSSRSEPSSYTTKTHEELSLENSSLRASLDTLAVHAHTLEKQLSSSTFSTSTLSAPAEDQPTPRTKSSVLPPEGVRINLGKLKKEVEAVWRSEEERVLEMSRMVIASSAGAGGEAVQRLEDYQRITRLEREVAALKAENEKQRSTIAHYHSRFTQIKDGARRRRAEKEAATSGAGAPGSIPTISEEPAG